MTGEFLVHLREAVEKFRDGVREYDAYADPSTDTIGKREKFYGALAVSSARDSEIFISDPNHPVCKVIIGLRKNGPGLLSLDQLILIQQAWELYDKELRARDLADRGPGQIA